MGSAKTRSYEGEDKLAEIASENDLVLLLGKDRKRFIVRLKRGEEFHSHRGRILHDDLIGQPWGGEVLSHLRYPFWLLEPSIHDLIMDVRRRTQIVYPKESGYILLKMNIRSGSRVIEAGTGSGALTITLAQAVAPEGRVYSYEEREDMLALAERNLTRVGLLDYVELKQRDIAEGFDERDVEALFLDVRSPHHYLLQAREALKCGGFLGAVVPTANQVSNLLRGLEEEGFVDIEVCEILLRPYKTVPARLRPVDRMVAHTGYLIFARPVALAEP